ncbi:MAG: PASTA domain-containing protein, partial [Atopobium sp.]|nr:PASTA domain-containing protein [Atopobium sp.]
RGGDTGRLNRVHSREEADELDKRENKRHKRNVILGVLGALVVLALAGFAIAQMLGNSAQQYLVPQFVGQTKDQATQALNASDSHFKLGTVTESYSDSAPEGQVIDQTPSANKQAPEGTAVNLVISKGAKPAAAVKVPDLTNKSPSEAESALAAVGLKARNGDSVESNDVTVGYVATQEPAAGSDAKAGDTITYHLSTGKGKADVPDVTEMTAERASDVLKDAGFKVDTQQQPSSSVPEGRVISQSPANGKADKGSTVTIVVSSGAQSGSVPSVVGKDFETAQTTLENAGFQVNTVWVYDDNVATGNVVGQTPSSAAPGATITIRVSSGPRPSA